MMHFGLIGRELGHSFSQNFFQDKFKTEGISDASYELFELPSIATFSDLIQLFPKLKGLNVTIPYKSEVMRYLHLIDENAARIGAVNTIEFLPNGILKGWNTDYIGFRDSLLPLLKAHHTQALIFGSGGAAKATQAVLRDLQIPYRVISRDGENPYKDLTKTDINEFPILINTTPLGMFPKSDECVPIPYEGITSDHLLFDMVYNPEETLFLKKGLEAGAQVKNGLEMLHLQAEAAWNIWMRQGK
jgi:shikimate dehydrogenase